MNAEEFRDTTLDPANRTLLHSKDVNLNAPKRRPCVELLDEQMVAILRAKVPAERIAMVFDAERTMRLLLEAHLRSRHPDWSAPRIAAEIARRRRLGSS
ncbi:MAG TPA: hypothetical protein VGY55_00955 [Pirellulales bacterium]|jgi:hypothetical protein|nr:hypothetical protein [Pirellulales bacterium]